MGSVMNLAALYDSYVYVELKIAPMDVTILLFSVLIYVAFVHHIVALHNLPPPPV